jgi:exonuclease SbcD
MTVIAQIGDTHLGRRMYGVSLLEDQRHALDQIAQHLEDQRPDVLLVTGDVYDRAIPPAEAIDLLDGFVYRVTQDLGIRTVMIPGNHDSASRLGFGARLMADLTIAPPFQGPIEPVVISHADGPVEIFPVPYLEPARVRQLLGDPEVVDQQTAMARVIRDIRDRATSDRVVVMGHAFVTGGETSESERPLAIGGAETIDASVFEGLTYVALGHLHRPQAVDGDRVQYAGSMLKYSLSEVDHDKSIIFATLGPGGEVGVERLPITPRRDLRRIEGRLEEILAEGPQGNADDYVMLSLTNKGPVFDAMARAREIYPNTLHIERPSLVREGAVKLPDRDHRTLQIGDLFTAFFEEVTSEPMSDEEGAALRGFLGAVDEAGETP